MRPGSAGTPSPTGSTRTTVTDHQRSPITRRSLGITPMAYLRQVRLARAHEDLATTDPAQGRSVRDIAYKWGFNHVPRFAAAYRERYGVLPSETLRKV
ncbi:helix-turn-helix transcriptional regulator [Rhodococcus opacus]|uniref:helix-turn-helix transcriptional regulator n=1 Tax=Rhodococcus opacus TaxID=37919 RepID=UPI00294A5623|nr:helix-turn-helix transcriptional regulator [Rhodococcus opacus]MDV6247997.1 helix-turn-helix transcriptional regulator [Rhodococcus opacus]